MSGKSDTPSRPRRATAQMVADLAGVSRSAVSRVFSKSGYVDAEKRELIYRVAAQIGYQPNALAASLQGARSHLVAVISGDIRNPHDTFLIHHLCEVLNREGFWPILVNGGASNGGAPVEDTLRFPLDALIVRAGSMSEDLVNRCTKLGIPMISYGRILRNNEADAVYCRNFEGMCLATDMLLSKGRTRFGYIAGPEGFFSSAERRRGVETALKRRGHAILAEACGDFTASGGHAAASRLLDKAPDLDAVLCANDASAIGVLTALRERGLCVPDDISVVGFDDIEMSRWPTFALTTVRSPVDQIVKAIVDLLLQRISQPERQNVTQFIMPELVLRKTH